MRYAGIDIASEKHFVAVVDDASVVLEKSTGFTEDTEGYLKLFRLLGPAEHIALVGMEATGHYWKNIFAALTAKGYRLALINPLRTNRFAGEDLQRTKTDAIDALGIARFAAQKRPEVTRLPDSATEELKELVRLRDRLMQDFGDRVRELHRVVDLGFPEFTRYVRTLDSHLATAILTKYLDKDIERRLDSHEVGKLLTTIDGIGTGTAARLIAVLGNPADFRDEKALASYVGVVPALRQSGKRTSQRAASSSYGNADLRTALYMPTLTAVKRNPWLKAFYDRLVLAGKPKKLALIAAMRKLLHAIYSVAKNKKPFVPRLEATT